MCPILHHPSSIQTNSFNVQSRQSLLCGSCIFSNAKIKTPIPITGQESTCGATQIACCKTSHLHRYQHICFPITAENPSVPTNIRAALPGPFHKAYLPAHTNRRLSEGQRSMYYSRSSIYCFTYYMQFMIINQLLFFVLHKTFTFMI